MICAKCKTNQEPPLDRYTRYRHETECPEYCCEICWFRYGRFIPIATKTENKKEKP